MQIKNKPLMKQKVSSNEAKSDGEYLNPAYFFGLIVSL
jgi:hypothetical protein